TRRCGRRRSRGCGTSRGRKRAGYWNCTAKTRSRRCARRRRRRCDDDPGGEDPDGGRGAEPVDHPRSGQTGGGPGGHGRAAAGGAAHGRARAARGSARTREDARRAHGRRVPALQSPIRPEGTYPATAPQLDRSMLKVRVGYPTRDGEKEIVARMASGRPIEVQRIAEADDILAARSAIAELFMDQKVVGYI